MKHELEAQTFAVIDVETTGLNPRIDRVVEFGYVLVRGGHEIERGSWLVDPECPIPARATAIHGITDGDVAGSPTLAELAPKFRARFAGAALVAHNARFDLAFLPFLGHLPAICSMRLARMTIPDAPDYTNQGLRRFLKFNDHDLSGLAAHRALADAIVTSRIFRIALDRYLASGLPDRLDAIATLSGIRRVA